jgi:hypothetical protein
VQATSQRHLVTRDLECGLSEFPEDVERRIGDDVCRIRVSIRGNFGLAIIGRNHDQPDRAGGSQARGNGGFSNVVQ